MTPDARSATLRPVTTAVPSPPSASADAALHLSLALAALPGNLEQKAAALGAHRTTLYRWTSGRTVPREEDWALLARLLDIPVAVLRYGPTPVLRSCLPAPKPSREETVRMTGTVGEVAARTGHNRSTVLRWRRAAQA